MQNRFPERRINTLGKSNLIHRLTSTREKKIKGQQRNWGGDQYKGLSKSGGAKPSRVMGKITTERKIGN